jgi:hypothetical protein
MPSERAPRRARRGLAVGCLALASLALTGCMELTTSVEVRDDRSASIVIEAYPDADTLLAAGGEDALDAFVAAAENAAGDSGVQVDKLEDRRIPGVRITTDEVPDAGQLADPIVVPGGPTLQWFTRFDLRKGGDGWTLDAELAPLSSIVAAIAGPARDDLGRIDYTVRISLPGRVVSTNATERDGSTAIWKVDAGAGTSQRLSMATETGLFVSPIVLGVAGVALLIVIGIALVISGERWSVRRRLRRDARTATGTSTWAPTPGGGLPSGPGAPPATGAAPASAGKGLYSDLTGDTSVALPVGGAAWGPPPPEASVVPPADVVPAPPATGPVEPPDPGPAPAPTAADAPGPDPSAAPDLDPSALPPPPAHEAPLDLPPPVDDPGPRADTEERSAAEDPAAAQPPQVRVVAPGWYPDPDAPGRSRFWDGNGWTDHTT